MKYLLAVLILGAAALNAAAETTPQRLFHIERNKNANIVVYDVMVLPDGNLPEKDKDTVDVYWLKLAEDGERKGLKKIERKMAYGLDIEGREGNRLTIKMKADIGRLVTVEAVDGTYLAFLDINDRPAVLEKVFIFATEGGVMPTVEYIELFGTDRESGEEAYEKFEP